MLRNQLLLVPIAAAILIGCGGSGGGSPAVPTGGTAVFLTDDLSSHDHVWATVRSVSVTLEGGGVRTLFNSSEGVQVDLRSLRDSTGARFKFLTRAVLEGPVSELNVTLAEQVVLFPAGASTGNVRTLAGAVGGNAVLTKTFMPALPPGNDELVIDFRLSEWVETGGIVTGVIDVITDDVTINDPDRHDAHDYKGVISGLSGTVPSQQFNLSFAGQTIRVVTDATTAIFNSNAAANPTLANGQRVEVRGIFSMAQTALVATSIKIKIEDGEDYAEAMGAAANYNSVADTFELTQHETSGFLPTTDRITVQLTPLTRYFGRRGLPLNKDDFHAALTATGFVEVEGTWDAGTNTLTATKAKVEDAGDTNDEGEACVSGPVSNVNEVAGTFSVRGNAFAGMNIVPGTLVSVATQPATIYKNALNAILTRAEFFALLQTANAVEVEGIYNPQTRILTAYKAKAKNEDVEEGEVFGPTSHFNADAGTLEITVREFEFLPVAIGQRIGVTTNANTRFKIENVQVSKAQFYEALAGGTLVEAEGVFNPDTFTLLARLLKIELP